MTDLLLKVKAALGVTGTALDSQLELYIDEVKQYLLSAGVIPSVVESDKSVGVIIRGVADLWNYGNSDTKLSEYFYQRAEQLRSMQ